MKKALAKGRDDRFQDAQSFTEALDAALADSELRASGEPSRTATRCRACGTVNALGQKFCGECGAAILSTTPPQSASGKA